MAGKTRNWVQVPIIATIASTTNAQTITATRPVGRATPINVGRPSRGEVMDPESPAECAFAVAS